MTPHVTIKHRVTGQGYPFTESFVYYGGQTFYSRHWSVIADTPHARGALAQQFLDRLKRFPSIAAGYEAQVANVAVAMNEIKSHDDLIAFAKEGAPILNTLPKPKRPALSLVKN
jgi:hypothetical protein